MDIYGEYQTYCLENHGCTSVMTRSLPFSGCTTAFLKYDDPAAIHPESLFNEFEICDRKFKFPGISFSLELECDGVVL